MVSKTFRKYLVGGVSTILLVVGGLELILGNSNAIIYAGTSIIGFEVSRLIAEGGRKCLRD